ncbi:MAG: hypothetical protein LBV51_01370 [Acholeplasmatales bacterium]|jgi:nitrogen regulatory protein PII|nr:hypothetical protein [Acholeplasmatales bacterium]
MELELIMTICNHGSALDVVKSAKEAGAKGGTIIHARGSDTEETRKFFGIVIQPEKDVVLIVCKADEKKAIMLAIMKDNGSNSQAHSVVFSLPVDEAIGINL